MEAEGELKLAYGKPNDHISDPRAPSDPDEMKECKKNDAKASVIVGLLISHLHAENVQGRESAFYMWTEVLSLFHKRTFLVCLNARHRFKGVKMSDRKLFFVDLT